MEIKEENYVRIEKLNDNKIHLEVGSSCVKTINVIITDEAFSGFLTAIYLKENKISQKWLEISLQWDEEYNKKVMAGCKTF